MGKEMKVLKVLVFKDWEKTKGVLEEVVRTGVPSAWNGVWSILLGHTLDDPVVFEAEVLYPAAVFDHQTFELCTGSFDALRLPKDKFKNNEKLLCIVTRLPEKPKEKNLP